MRGLIILLVVMVIGVRFVKVTLHSTRHSIGKVVELHKIQTFQEDVSEINTCFEI